MWPFSSESAISGERFEGVESVDDQPRLLEQSESSFGTQSIPQPELQHPSIPDDVNRPQWITNADARLGIPTLFRIPMLLATSAACGFILGGAKGGPIAADRYRAENAHRVPTTKSGWFLYHKTKNYHLLIGSMREGFKFGTVLMGWATLFAISEEMIDLSRARLFARRIEDENRVSHHRDAVSTVMAGMSVAGLYSWRRGFDHFGAARMSKMAFKYSLMYGLLQDAVATLGGRRPAYVDWVVRHTFGSPKHDQTT